MSQRLKLCARDIVEERQLIPVQFPLERFFLFLFFFFFFTFGEKKVFFFFLLFYILYPVLHLGGGGGGGRINRVPVPGEIQNIGYTVKGNLAGFGLHGYYHVPSLF